MDYKIEYRKLLKEFKHLFSQHELLKAEQDRVLTNFSKLEQEFEQYRNESVKWGAVDFIDRAEENDWKITEEKAQEALEDMIAHHDCNNGITWDTVDYYIGQYGEEQEQDFISLEDRKELFDYDDKAQDSHE